MAQELVELRANLHHARRALLLDDHVRDLVTVRLPVGLRDAQRARREVRAAGANSVRSAARTPSCEGPIRRGDALLHLEGLEDEECLAHVAVGVLGDELRGVVGDREALVPRDVFQHGLHLRPEIEVSTCRPAICQPEAREQYTRNRDAYKIVDGWGKCGDGPLLYLGLPRG